MQNPKNKTTLKKPDWMKISHGFSVQA